MINWHIVTSEMYHNGTPTEGHLYFLSDTREIYRGSEPFTESVIVYTELPTSPALNRLYINATTLEGKIWQGAELGWKTVINAVADTVSADVGGVAVSGKAVAAYVAAALAEFATASESVSSLTWDAADHLLTITKADESTENIVFEGLGVSLSYETATGKLQLLDAAGTAIGDPISLDLERFVTAGEYNVEEKAIYLYFDADKTESVKIPVEELVDLYTATGTATLDLSVTGNNITGSVKISTASGNLITVDENGLYVAPIDISGKMDKVAGAVEGNIAVLGADGQVVDSGKAFEDIVPNNQIFKGASIEDAVAGNTPVKGDYCIVAKPIGTTDKVERTAYIYNGEAWEALDGNYSAENVYFPADLQTTHAIGNITLNNGQATVPAAGKNLVGLWNALYVQEKNPSKTEPSVSLTFSQVKAYEVGSVVEPSFSATLNPGSYTYGPATGITAKAWTITDSDGRTANANSGSFDSFTVGDNTKYSITAKADYDAGAVPLTNLGNEYASGQIAAGSKSATKGNVTGYRNCFYGTLTSKDGDVNSDVIRALTGKTNSAVTAGKAIAINIPVGAVRVILAYPATVRAVNSITDKNGMGAQVKTAFAETQLDVEGANNYDAIPYRVYVCDFAEAAAVANTYNVTI